MKVNYVLMYGTPYLKYREFETFEDVSKFLVNKGICDYTIFEKMDDKKEVEMIYRDNDIHVLEETRRKANNNILKVIAMIKTHEMTKQEIVQRLMETSKILEMR